MSRPLLITPRGQFALQSDETLLAALERTGHAVEYQCRSGYCGACRLHLVNPEDAMHLHYPTPPLAHVGRGEVLPCCCQSRGRIALRLTHAEQLLAEQP
jgi:ferredoxin